MGKVYIVLKSGVDLTVNGPEINADNLFDVIKSGSDLVKISEKGNTWCTRAEEIAHFTDVKGGE